MESQMKRDLAMLQCVQIGDLVQLLRRYGGAGVSRRSDGDGRAVLLPHEWRFGRDLHGIDSGDSQGITNCAVCGRTAALHEYIIFAAKIDNVPND